MNIHGHVGLLPHRVEVALNGRELKLVDHGAEGLVSLVMVLGDVLAEGSWLDQAALLARDLDDELNIHVDVDFLLSGMEQV